MPVVKGGELTITCETEGASIAYRRVAADDTAAWQVYTAPLGADPGASYEAVAHRIGFRRSPIVQVVVRRSARKCGQNTPSRRSGGRAPGSLSKEAAPRRPVLLNGGDACRADGCGRCCSQ